MSILDKIKKNSSIKESAILSKSKFFTQKDMIPTAVPAVNIALSGKLDGGLTPGLTMWAGPSKHFKTAFSLLMAKSYMEKYEDAALLFYDSEFGTPQSYFDSFGIDTDRVLHTPITDIEQLKFDIMSQLTQFERGEHVIKPSNGWYSKVNVETGEVDDKKYREKETNESSFWIDILKSETFQSFVEGKYRVASSEILQDSDIENTFSE